jgi:hypothetical protein
MVLAALLPMLSTPVLAQESPVATDGSGAPPAGLPEPPYPETRWLDEVRAQRRAWEERRQAARDTFEARRRLNDPRGAAHQEAWEEDVRRRRETRLQRMEQDREYFRGLRQPPFPWYQLQGPASGPSRQVPDWVPNQPPEPPGAGTGDPSTGTDFYPPAAAQTGPFSPDHWDNLWYFRGY